MDAWGGGGADVGVGVGGVVGGGDDAERLLGDGVSEVLLRREEREWLRTMVVVFERRSVLCLMW